MLRDDPDNNLPLMQLGEFSGYYVFRMQNLVALIYMYIGYGYAALNVFSEANRAYQRADYILLKTPPDDQVVYAELKNNLARTMAELGATRIARTLCDEGIAFSRRLGLEYLVAIGFNTKALIYTLDHRPDEAYQNATDALQIFRQLNDARGIGLAQIQVGEACRHRFNSLYDRLPAPRLMQLSADLHALLEQANTALAEAAEIFGSDADDVGSTSSAFRAIKRVPERSRLIETRVYQGCLYRDWANTLGQQPGNDIFDRAMRAFDEALALMRGEGYQRMRLSALIDKAWLYKRSKHVQVAWEIAQVALAEAPTHHMLMPERPLDLTQVFDPAIFRELSKLESLFADIDEQVGQFADSLGHRALAITYLQLFSSSETTYLDLNIDKLYQLLNNERKEKQDRQRDFLPLARQIVQRYHLDQLFPQIGPLRFLQIVEDSFAPLTDLTYLRETVLSVG
jgi:tetratricopeptide (TPR) repeat protein